MPTGTQVARADESDKRSYHLRPERSLRMHEISTHMSTHENLPEFFWRNDSGTFEPEYSLMFTPWGHQRVRNGLRGRRW